MTYKKTENHNKTKEGLTMPIEIELSQETVTHKVIQSHDAIPLEKQVDPKYFSKNMTGNGKQKRGLFHVDSATISQFMQDKRRLLQNVTYPNDAYHKNVERHTNHVFGNFYHKSPKSKTKEYTKYENNLTSMLPPLLLESVVNNVVALSFPKQTAMFNLNALETIWTPVSKGTIDNQAATTYALTVVQSMRLYAKETQTQLPSGHVSNESKQSAMPEIYVLFATVLDSMADKAHIVFANHQVHAGKQVNEHQGVASIHYLAEKTSTEYDYDQLEEQLDNHLSTVLMQNNVQIPSIDSHSLSLLIGDQPLYEILTRQATTITHQSEEALLTFIKTFAAHTHSLVNKQPTNKDLHVSLISTLITYVQHLDILNELEDNLVTTNMLADIYSIMNTTLKSQKAVNIVARHSLRLLLSQRLAELKELRDNNGLYQFKPQNQQVNQAVAQSLNYSNAQKQIITTTDPLVIGQAGAGSGKSHTLVGRINYLEAQNEDLAKVLILSFTNVAAINITNRFPGVRSETLANMFNTIYSATFPLQALSSPSTVANSMRLLEPNSSYFTSKGLDPDTVSTFIKELAERLEQFDQTGFKRVNVQQELKRVSNLIENNVELATSILDAVEQTTLELQPIIIHHILLKTPDKLNIPIGYQQLNYIITDESQDISTFEYILLLELTLHYRSQLLIIGDGSQTLYEFRNSDPRYMNALEASDVFTSHKLETNYRSNEEILMMANQFLKVIDANKYANIQLKSSSFRKPTEASFNETITIIENPVNGTSMADYQNGLGACLESSDKFEEWFIERVQKGEQVAIMGWTRKEVLLAGEKIENLLQKHQLGLIPIVNIMSNNEKPMIILSRFVKEMCNQIRSLVPQPATYRTDMQNLIDTYASKHLTKSTPKSQNFIKDVILRQVDEMIATPVWHATVQDYYNQRMNEHAVGSFVIQYMLRAETRRNSMSQFLRKRKDIPNYDKCPIILSTIHGTKGLEFEHTVILFNEAKKGSVNQESMRMMFVALSRAKKSELIINSFIPSRLRTVSDTLSAMHQTPISTAYMRTLHDVRVIEQDNMAGQATT